METNAQVIVIGGGPAGSACAIGLRKRGCSVLLVDDARQDRPKIGESLPPACNPVLRRLGMDDACMRKHHLPAYGNRSAWGTELIYEVDFIKSPYGHGWHLDRNCFDADLRQCAASLGTRLLAGSRVMRLRRDGSGGRDGWQLDISAPEGRTQREAELVVDASGRRTFLARHFAIPRRRLDRMLASYGFFAQQSSGDERADRDGRTLVESVDSGWWYTALLPGHRRVAAFFHDAGGEQDNRRASFEDALRRTRHVSKLIDGRGYRLLGEPARVGAESYLVERVCGDGWLCIGDAASAYDPISSQGILAALYQGELAAERCHALLNGQTGALDEHQRFVDRRFAEFRHNRRLAYAAEQRWRNNSFWRRRHSEPADEALPYQETDAAG